ncbi:MAG: hypothetical protein E7638_00030 [Ruminococcaceae bacterium]|nr:hypothetical protein [Oscillospiraceae bacterium]
MTEYGFNFDYTKTMMMKMFLAVPDKDGGSNVKINFERALDIIKKTDALTLGVPKIIYLVGWQYNGHDNRYPDLFEVNKALKRPDDATALDSLVWLMEESKRFNTTVSFHVNFTDAYTDSEQFTDYLSAGALIRKPDGTPDPIEEYNDKECYKISFYEEWNSGLFRRRFERFLASIPAAQTGTIHVDNFQCYYNNAPEVDIADAQKARSSIIDYVRSRGLDITSELAYREGPDGRDNYNKYCRTHSVYPIDIIGRIPAVWWITNVRDEEYLAYPPQQLTGGMPGDPAFLYTFYGNIQGEHLWGAEGDAWIAPFLREFCMIQLPYFYLCDHKREGIENDESGKTAFFSDGIISRSADETISKNGITLKDAHSVLLPLTIRPDIYVFYSDNGFNGSREITECTFTRAKVSKITSGGIEPLYETTITDGRISLRANARDALLIEKIV